MSLEIGNLGGGDLDVWIEHFGEPAASPAAGASTAAALVAAEETKEQDDSIAPSLAAIAAKGVQSETARDALFAAGDFSRLFSLGWNEEFETSLRRRGRAPLARRG